MHVQCRYHIYALPNKLIKLILYTTENENMQVTINREWPRKQARKITDVLMWIINQAPTITETSCLYNFENHIKLCKYIYSTGHCIFTQRFTSDFMAIKVVHIYPDQIRLDMSDIIVRNCLVFKVFQTRCTWIRWILMKPICLCSPTVDTTCTHWLLVNCWNSCCHFTEWGSFFFRKPVTLLWETYSFIFSNNP